MVSKKEKEAYSCNFYNLKRILHTASCDILIVHNHISKHYKLFEDTNYYTYDTYHNNEKGDFSYLTETIKSKDIHCDKSRRKFIPHKFDNYIVTQWKKIKTESAKDGSELYIIK